MRRTIAFYAVAVITALGSTPAWAACSPSTSFDPITGTLTADVDGCHLIVENPPILPVSTSPINPGDPLIPPAGIELIIRNSSTGEVGSDDGVIIDTVNQNMQAIVEHSATQDAVIGDNKLRSESNQNRLNTFNGTGDTVENWADSVDIALGDQQQAIDANTAVLSQHAATLDDHAKGLAISMAMPDAWLSDSKSFGIFGSVGGFDDETALGFAAIGRLDETWSVNGKLGADTDFDHFGWQAGFGAQW